MRTVLKPITTIFLIALLAGNYPVSLAWAEQQLGDADFLQFSEAQVELGRLLFFDKILSGNRNISCSTCHHPQLGTTDNLSLGVGEGGVGLGLKRTAGKARDRIKRRVPRNAPALWNLGALEIDVLMHDGRISVSDIYQNSFNTPAREWLPQGLVSVVAAQKNSFMRLMTSNQQIK